MAFDRCVQLDDVEEPQLDPELEPPAVGRSTLTSRHVLQLSADQRRAHHARLDADWAAGPVQLKRDGGGRLDDAEVRAAAGQGLSAPGGRLPHLDAIQRSFGHHDVRGVTAHVGGAARDANRALGSHGYATGDHVAFAETPSLFLAAHEAAHVVQQRAGVHLSSAVGQVGDSYEQNADAVAARVVAGESAVDLLGPATSASPANGPVQCKGDDGAGAALDALANNLPGRAELFAFLQPVAAGDKATALARWPAVPAVARGHLRSSQLLARAQGYPSGLRADPIESILLTIGPESIALLTAANVPVITAGQGAIILADEGRAPLWVTALTANASQMTMFVEQALPTAATATVHQARQIAVFADATTGNYPKQLFERIYPALIDTSYDEDDVRTRPWRDTDVLHLFHAFRDNPLPPAHVRTIAGGFYLGIAEKKNGGWSPLEHGYYSGGRVVMPAARRYGTFEKHGMTGGAMTTSGRTLDHRSSTLLHEVGHGVGARSGGDAWAMAWGDWKPLDADTWSLPLFDEAAAKGLADPLLWMGYDLHKMLRPRQARLWLAAKIAGRAPAPIVTTGRKPTDVKSWNDAEVEQFIVSIYGSLPLAQYYRRRKSEVPGGAFKADNQNLVGGRYYTYLDAWESHASYDKRVFDHRPSEYSLSSHSEWFAECYTEYYRTDKQGGMLAAEVKEKLDQIDAMKLDPDDKKVGASSKGEGPDDKYEQTFGFWQRYAPD
jgi:hypothetical protein